MTNITLHGILGKEFGENLKLNLNRTKYILKAIDVNKKNFINRINELSREGLNYTIIIDNQKIQDISELDIKNTPQEIHLVPMIVGSGAAIGAAVLTGISAGLAGIGIGTATVFTSSMLASQIVGGLILSAVSLGLQYLLADNESTSSQASASTKALEESFIFSNKVNLANQGSPVPIGYGRLKVGAQVIQFSIKSYQQSRDTRDAYTQDQFNIGGLDSNSSQILSRKLINT